MNSDEVKYSTLTCVECVVILCIHPVSYVLQPIYRVSLKELYSDDFDFFATRKCKGDQFVHIGLICSILAAI